MFSLSQVILSTPPYLEHFEMYVPIFLINQKSMMFTQYWHGNYQSVLQHVSLVLHPYISAKCSYEIMAVNPSSTKPFLPTHSTKGGGISPPPRKSYYGAYINSNFIFPIQLNTNEEDSHKNEVSNLYTLRVVNFQRRTPYVLKMSRASLSRQAADLRVFGDHSDRRLIGKVSSVRSFWHQDEVCLTIINDVMT